MPCNGMICWVLTKAYPGKDQYDSRCMMTPHDGCHMQCKPELEAGDLVKAKESHCICYDLIDIEAKLLTEHCSRSQIANSMAIRLGLA